MCHSGDWASCNMLDFFTLLSFSSAVCLGLEKILHSQPVLQVESLPSATSFTTGLVSQKIFMHSYLNMAVLIEPLGCSHFSAMDGLQVATSSLVKD